MQGVPGGFFPADALQQCDVAVLGEHHNRPEDHRMQADFVRAFASAQGRPPAIGLEMVQQQFQPALDRFNRGEMAVDDLYEATEWSERWVWPFEDYKPIFVAAREAGAPLVALNTASETQRQVPLRGFEALTAKDYALYLPDKAGFAASLRLPGFKDYVDNIVMASYGTHLRASWLGSQDAAEATPRNFLVARLLRDEAMAAAAWRWLLAHGSMVLLVGCDHVKFEYGVPQRLQRLGEVSERYEVLVPGVNVRRQPEPSAEVTATLAGGEVVRASGTSGTYLQLADGRGFALSRTEDRELLRPVITRPLRVSTVLLNPTAADSLSGTAALQLSLPLEGLPRKAWPKLADYVWADTPERPSKLGVVA